MSKKIVTHRLSLDLSDQKLQATVTLGFGDLATHRLVVDLRYGADVLELPPGSYAIAVQNGVDVLDSVTVYGSNGAYPNCIVYDITTAVTGVEGVHEAQFKISYVELGVLKSLTSPKIAFVVKKDILLGSDVVTSEPYSAVVLARERAEQFAKDAKASEENAAKALGEHKTDPYAHKALFDTVLDQLRKKGEALDADIQQLLNDVSAAMLDHDQDIHAHENLLTRSFFVEKIGKVTDHYTGGGDGVGLMTETQSKNLSLLTRLLSDNDPEFIDNLNEVLAAFAGMGEDKTVLNLLAAKADVAALERLDETLSTRIEDWTGAVQEAFGEHAELFGTLEERIAALESGSGSEDSDKEYYVLLDDHKWITITKEEKEGDETEEGYAAYWEVCPECDKELGIDEMLTDAVCRCPYCDTPLRWNDFDGFEIRETGSGTGKIYIQGNLDGDGEEDDALKYGLDGLHLVDNYGEENETDITVTEDFLRNKCVFDADSAVYVYTYTNTVFVYDDKTEWIINGESNDVGTEDEFVYYAPEDVIIEPLY